MPSTRLLVLATLVVLVTAPVSQAVAVDAPTPASTTASTATDRPTPAVGPQAASITNGSVEATANGSAGAVDDQGPENRTDAGSAVASSAASAAAGPGAVGTALAVVESAANTTNYMDVRNRDVERDGYARSSVDVFGAIEHDVAAIRSNYTAASLEHETAAQSDRATVESIRTAVDRITRRIDALKTRQERAFERYNAREWSTRRFLRELSTVDAVARGLEYRLGRMDGVFRQDLPQVVGEIPAVADEDEDRVRVLDLRDNVDHLPNSLPL